jgi:Bacterial Ig-like domain (group 3)
VKRLTKPLGTIVAVAMIAAGLLVFTAGSALAVTPPWEPDPFALGSVTFYNSSGAVITGGNDLAHIADYAAASSGPSSGFASFYFGVPDHTKVFPSPPNNPDPSQWNQDLQGSSAYPNGSAPAPINGLTHPVVSFAPGDACAICTIGGFTQDSTAGWANLLEARVYDTDLQHYWRTDISYNSAAGTWQVEFPAAAATTTSITTTPPDGGSALSGTNVTMTATVAPAASANGSVQFMDDFPAVHSVGSPQAVTTGSPTTALVTDTAPPDGVHHYTAVFTPTDPSTVAGSTSPQSTVTIHPPQTTTSTSILAAPNSAPQFTPVVLTANVTPTAAAPGSMQFFDGPSSLGTQTTDDGTVGEYRLTVSSLSVGTHAQIHATFTPTNVNFAPSTSPNTTVTITPSACPGDASSICTDPQNLQVSVGNGSITIDTPYTPTNPFVLPAMQLVPGGTMLSSSAQFPASGQFITVTSTLAGNPDWTVSVSGTDLTSGTGTIDGMGLGLTAGTQDSPPPPSVTFTSNPAHAPGSADGNVGIKGGPFTFAHTTGGGLGTAQMHGTLTLLAPTSTPAGTYTGTITFTVA